MADIQVWDPEDIYFLTAGFQVSGVSPQLFFLKPEH